MSSEQIITRHRMARAHRLADVIQSLGGTPADQLDLARTLTVEQWADMVGFLDDVHQAERDDTGHRFVPFAERAPSETTIAMAIGILEAAAAVDDDALFALVAQANSR